MLLISKPVHYVYKPAQGVTPAQIAGCVSVHYVQHAKFVLNLIYIASKDNYGKRKRPHAYAHDLIVLCCTKRIYPAALLSFEDFGIIAEEQRNTPQTRQTDQRKDYTAEAGCLTAEKPRDKVKPEDTDGAPVDCADDGQNECQLVKHLYFNSFAWHSYRKK